MKLNQFMISISENILIRSSDLFKDFVTLPNKEFDKIKLEYNKKKIPTFIKDYLDFDGTLDVSINEQKENICSGILIDIKTKNLLFYELQIAIKSLIEEFKVMSDKLNNVSNVFQNLSHLYSISLNGEFMKKTFNSFNNLFLDWSKSYINQMNFFSYDFFEFFKYMDLELQTFKNLDDNYVSRKKNYLYYKKQFDTNLENAEALMKIKNNVLMSKTMYGYYLNKYYNEYFRLNEVHSTRLKKLINKLNNQKDVFYSDMVKLIQFLSIGQ